MLALIIEALEGWGIKKLFSWLSSLFSHTKDKDIKEAHEVSDSVAARSDNDVVVQLQSEWGRKS